MCKLRQITHNLNTSPLGFTQFVCVGFARVYMSIKSTKNKIHSLDGLHTFKDQTEPYLPLETGFNTVHIFIQVLPIIKFNHRYFSALKNIITQSKSDQFKNYSKTMYSVYVYFSAKSKMIYAISTQKVKWGMKIH